MHRRQFIELALGALSAGVLSRCTSHVAHAEATRPSRALPKSTAASFHAQRRFAATRFGQIAYVERGAGDAALFLHGFPLNGYQWRGAMARLSAHRRCIAPDFMALGYSRIAEGQSVEPQAQVGMLMALLDQLSVGKVDLVANDSGGAVAQLFAVQHPERVRSLLLTNCDVENDSPPPSLLPLIALARAGKFADQTFLPQLADKSVARSPQGLGGQCYSRPQELTDDTIDTYLAPLVSSSMRKAQTNAYCAALERNPLAGIGPALARCTIPARIVWGTADTIFSQASAEYLDQTLPNSQGITRLEGAKLFFPEEYPDIIADEARLLWGVK